MGVSIPTANSDRQRDVLYAARWMADTFADQISGHFPLWAMLRERKRMFEGGFGDYINFPVEHPAAGGPAPRGVVDPMVATTPALMTGMSKLKFLIAEYFVNVGIPNREVRADRPPARRVEYVGNVYRMTLNRFFDKMRQDLMAPESSATATGTESCLGSLFALINKGSTAATGPYQPYALPYQYSADNDSIGWTDARHGIACGSPASYVVGNIDRNAAGNVYHCAPVVNPSSPATFGRTPINRTLIVASNGAEKPDLGFLDMEHYAALADILQAQYALAPSKLQKYGYTALNWMGCEITYDDGMPLGRGGAGTGQFLALNTDLFGLYADGSLEPEIVEASSIEAPYKGRALNGFYALGAKKIGRGIGGRHGNLASV